MECNRFVVKIRVGNITVKHKVLAIEPLRSIINAQIPKMF